MAEYSFNYTVNTPGGRVNFSRRIVAESVREATDLLAADIRARRLGRLSIRSVSVWCGVNGCQRLATTGERCYQHRED